MATRGLTDDQLQTMYVASGSGASGTSLNWMTPGARAITVMCWARIPAGMANDATHIRPLVSCGTGTGGWQLAYVNGKVFMQWRTGAGAPGASGDSSVAVLVNGSWQHIAFNFFSAPAGTWQTRCYVNAARLNASAGVASAPTSLSATVLSIGGQGGAFPTGTSNYSSLIEIAQARVFIGVLGPHEIRRAMFAAVLPPDLRSRAVADIPCEGNGWGISGGAISFELDRSGWNEGPFSPANVVVSVKGPPIRSEFLRTQPLQRPELWGTGAAAAASTRRRWAQVI